MSAKQDKDFKVHVPLEERPKNDVDRHYKYIEDIQHYCKHSFRFLQPPEFQESVVQGVFIIFRADWSGIIEPEEVELQCLHCSLRKVWDLWRLCSRCLYEGEFNKLDLHRRIFYFGEGYSYYRARLYSCPKCDLQMVADEWDR